MEYAGIGSRETPGDVLAAMTRIAEVLAQEGWTLCSGGADGADQAFASGVAEEITTERLRIYLPWRGYNGLSGPETRVLDRVQEAEAMELVSKHHPAWHRCKPGAQKLHARNAAIIHGPNLNQPVSAVICWTRNAVAIGGTATGIRMAEDTHIPVLNLARYTEAEVLQAMRKLAEINAVLDAQERAAAFGKAGY